MLKVKYFFTNQQYILYPAVYGRDISDSPGHFRLNSLVIKIDKEISGNKRQTKEKTEKATKHLLCPIADKVLTLNGLNNQPRKRLEFKTSNQVFFGD